MAVGLSALAAQQVRAVVVLQVQAVRVAEQARDGAAAPVEQPVVQVAQAVLALAATEKTREQQMV